MRRPTHGTLLQMADGAVYTTLAHVQSVTPPGLQTGAIVMADHDMTDVKGKLAEGLAEVTDLTARIYWDPSHATHTALLGVARSGATRAFRITFPNTGGQVDFSGFVSSFQPDAASASDGMLEADITIVPTTDITVV